MTLDQLRVFVAVAQRLHMTRAAEALNLTQSAVSAAIAALEARHGVRLFDRIGRGLALTEAGRAFLPEAVGVLGRAEAAARTLEDLAGLKRGAIAVAASQTVANYWLPSPMAAFANAHPGIALKLVGGNTAQVVQAVMEGEADVGFVEGDIEAPRIERVRVATDRLAIYAAPDHASARSALSVRDLEDLAWARREIGSSTRSEFEHTLADMGVHIDHMRTALELTSNEAVLEAAAGGGLVAAVSEMAARAFVASGRLVRLRFDLPRRHFDMVTHRERSRSPAVAAFIDHIGSLAQTLGIHEPGPEPRIEGREGLTSRGDGPS
jgi:DNA-binding transcriptional LysR family regulator